MPTIPGRGRLPGAQGRLLRGYGPGVVLIGALVVFTVCVPTVAPEQLAATRTASSSSGPDTSPLNTSTTPASRSRHHHTTANPTATTTGSTTAPSAGAPPPSTRRCTGRQIPDDPYSPPCVRWSGHNNGGATSPGVTANSINLTIRITDVANIGQVVQEITGDSGGKVQINETVADVKRTARVFVDYFNRHFTFYGRKINLEFFNGKGSLLTEMLGGGQPQAQADAITAAKQEHAFAEALAFTEPYADALTEQHVIAFNELYFSKQWFEQHSPYAYSLIPDCTKVVDGAVNAVTAILGTGHGAGIAQYAGGSLHDKPRKIAIIAPDTPVYQTCAELAKSDLRRLGIPIADFRTYPLDINSITNSTPQNLVTALAGEGITTVVLATDPVLPFFMTAKAALQNWYPEWVLTGVGLTDADYIGQLYDQSEWAHAFGVSFLGKQQPVRASDAYRAYESVSPSTTMAQLTGEFIYYALEAFSIGVQEAGPDLTPETFKEGLERYPGGTGQDGAWLFPPSDPYTPNVDSRIVWWNPKGISSYNDEPGTYDDNGKRYPLGHIPPGSTSRYLPGFHPPS